MSEMVAEAKTIIVYMIYDKCGNGIMERNNDVPLMTNPPQYFHTCNKCGNKEYYNKSYPYHKLVPIEVLHKPKEKEMQ